MISFYSIFLILFFTIFTVASILAQLKKSSISKYDFLGLLPSYRFFAPRPVTRDIKVYARALDCNNNYSNWKEFFVADKKWFSFIWNPQHRLKKTIIDIYSDIDQLRDSEKEIWYISFPYLILLYAATYLFIDNQKFEKVQFMITCYAGNEESIHDLIFTSNEHSIR